MKENNPLNTSWRKTALTIYKKPVDSKIFGSVEIDITDLEKYIAKKRKSGIKITLTHFFWWLRLGQSKNTFQNSIPM